MKILAVSVCLFFLFLPSALSQIFTGIEYLGELPRQAPPGLQMRLGLARAHWTQDDRFFLEGKDQRLRPWRRAAAKSRYASIPKRTLHALKDPKTAPDWQPFGTPTATPGASSKWRAKFGWSIRRPPPCSVYRVTALQSTPFAFAPPSGARKRLISAAAMGDLWLAQWAGAKDTSMSVHNPEGEAITGPFTAPVSGELLRVTRDEGFLFARWKNGNPIESVRVQASIELTPAPTP